MKRFLVTILFLSFILPGFTQVDKIAQEVLHAYKKRDAEALKKHASGMFKYVINEGYFNDESIQSDLNAVDNWSGEIKEIRYKTGDMMGKTVTMATVYYADNKENKDDIHVVFLSTTDKKNWVMLAGGLSTENREEFNQMDTDLRSTESAEKTISKNFSIEMANGDNISELNEASIQKCISALNDDNFYLIVNNNDNDGYMQAAFSDQGLIIQYSEDGNQFEAEDYLSMEDALKIIMLYVKNDLNWKEGNNWIEPSY